MINIRTYIHSTNNNNNNNENDDDKEQVDDNNNKRRDIHGSINVVSGLRQALPTNSARRHQCHHKQQIWTNTNIT